MSIAQIRNRYLRRAILVVVVPVVLTVAVVVAMFYGALGAIIDVTVVARSAWRGRQ